MLTVVISSIVLNGPIGDTTQLPVDLIPEITVPSIDYIAVEEENIERDVKGGKYCFAIPNEVSVTPKSHGVWEKLPNGKMRWSLRVNCDNGVSMNVGFGRYEMPESGSMVISDETREFEIRPFTAEDNKDHGELWTPIIPSHEAVIEIVVDRNEKNALSNQIELTAINPGYRGFKSENFAGSSGACNIDVLCEEGDDWWDVIPSVGVYTLSGYWTCSGAMVNNTAQDYTPYFLTANHCGVTNSSDSSIVVYWNHHNSYCRTPGSGASGGNGNGPLNQFTSGSTMRATRSYTDFTLTELSSSPNTSWGVTYAGWSRQTNGGSGAGIHHPSTAEKRISFPDYMNPSGEFYNVNWAEGTTEPGSSGSPLFDGNHRIVGQLCCGSASCSSDTNDYYGRSFGLSWSYLDDWLDPTGSNVQYLDTLGDEPVVIGACCIGTSGSCVNIAESNCNAGGGTWMGEGSSCDAGDCEPVVMGACCIESTGQGIDIEESTCNAGGGTWMGENSSCDAGDCDQNDCPTDTNGDGITNVTDLLYVVAEWGAGSSSNADVNGDGTVNVSDILEVVAAWGSCN